MNTLYVFVDESGNFDFSPNGTKYFILTLLSTTVPARIGAYLMALRYGLLPNYACGEKIHASEDKQEVRNYVFDRLLNGALNLRVDAVIAKKTKRTRCFIPSRRNSTE